MSQENPKHAPVRSSLLRNWMSLTGLVIVIGALFSFLMLFVLDSLAQISNPYISILTWMITPGFVVLGLLLTVIGIFRERRRRVKSDAWMPPVQIDLSRPRDRRIMATFLAGSVTFLLISAVGSYNTFQFTESVQFCGETCHGVMKPELTTHADGPHARVACVACHVGPGATWFVRSKLSGSYQVYAVAFNKYPRPITTPIKNLRPARETCEQCHWPQKFTGNLDKTYTYFQSDETNTPYSMRLSVKIGGSDPTHGPVGGIHWHMVVANTVEYIATDAARQQIPWVRITDAQGVVTVYHEPKFTNNPSLYEIRKMDCIDCHNRPAHRYVPPDRAVNLAMELGQIDRTLPWIKTNAIYVLTRNYTNEVEARESIATLLVARYPDDPRIRPAIAAVQQIYSDNFFPEMKANWSVYPDNIGHMRWPGCFRCHDGNHKTDDGKRSIDSHDCNSCHTILSQGSGAELLQLTPGGQPFKHPGGDYDLNCSTCHDGTL
jgi:hypothetical protein